MDMQARVRLIAAGQRAAESLGQSVAGRPGEAPIETNVGSLRGLAEVLSALVEDANRCGGVDCMGRSIDGTKLWVTRDRFEAVEQQAVRYRAALISIAQAGEASGSEFDMLVDWQGTVRALAQAARHALDGRGLA